MIPLAAAVLENVTTAALLTLALALTAIAFRAWKHSRTRKVLLLNVGFALFLVKGALLAVGLFTVSPWNSLLVPSLLLDLSILAVFYAAVIA